MLHLTLLVGYFCPSVNLRSVRLNISSEKLQSFRLIFGMSYNCCAHDSNYSSLTTFKISLSFSSTTTFNITSCFSLCFSPTMTFNISSSFSSQSPQPRSRRFHQYRYRSHDRSLSLRGRSLTRSNIIIF